MLARHGSVENDSDIGIPTSIWEEFVDDHERLLEFARAVKSFTYRSPNGYDTAYDEIRDLLNDLEYPA
jgi:hypothetical protein